MRFYYISRDLMMIQSSCTRVGEGKIATRDGIDHKNSSQTGEKY